MSIKKQTTKKRATKARATTAKKTKRTPKAKTSRAKASKSKLAGITQTNGKQYEESIETVRKLEELLEVRKTNPFGTADARIFNENIARMNLSDMQELAVRAGVFPSGNKTVLKNKLLRAFRAEGNGVVETNVVSASRQPKLDPKNPSHKAMIDYLNE